MTESTRRLPEAVAGLIVRWYKHTERGHDHWDLNCICVDTCRIDIAKQQIEPTTDDNGRWSAADQAYGSFLICEHTKDKTWMLERKSWYRIQIGITLQRNVDPLQSRTHHWTFGPCVWAHVYSNLANSNVICMRYNRWMDATGQFWGRLSTGSSSMDKATYQTIHERIPLDRHQVYRFVLQWGHTEDPRDRYSFKLLQ